MVGVSTNLQLTFTKQLPVTPVYIVYIVYIKTSGPFSASQLPQYKVYIVQLLCNSVYNRFLDASSVFQTFLVPVSGIFRKVTLKLLLTQFNGEITQFAAICHYAIAYITHSTVSLPSSVLQYEPFGRAPPACGPLGPGRVRRM